jgi:predicted aldo/keto reductase-like oxidoreductase
MDKHKVEKSRTIEILHKAMDLGINYFDTAVMYCEDQSEEILGKALERRRKDLYVSTKNHYNQTVKRKGDNPSQWQILLDQSLDRLGVNWIDFYHLHDLRLDQYTEHLLPSGVMDMADKAREEGLINHLCFSSHDDPQNIVKMIDTDWFDGILVQYNLLDRHNEQVIRYAQQKGLGVSIMGTVAGGQLASISEKIKGMTQDRESTPDLAIRFVLSNPGVSVALSGMDTQMVEENVASASRSDPITPEEKDQILAVIEEIKRLEGLYCTGCNYCMPCPFMVDIPANFAAYNLAKVWGLETQAKNQYRALGERENEGKLTPAWAKVCTACGKCESKCPQDIPIAEKLKETHQALSNNQFMIDGVLI